MLPSPLPDKHVAIPLRPSSHLLLRPSLTTLLKVGLHCQLPPCSHSVFLASTYHHLTVHIFYVRILFYFLFGSAALHVGS